MKKEIEKMLKDFLWQCTNFFLTNEKFQKFLVSYWCISIRWTFLPDGNVSIFDGFAFYQDDQSWNVY